MIKSGKMQPDEKDGLGRSPLIFAVDCDLPLDDCKRLVEECGCDANGSDENGDTLLHYALNLDNTALEKWLTEDLGISKDVKNKEGMTPYD